MSLVLFLISSIFDMALGFSFNRFECGNPYDKKSAHEKKNKQLKHSQKTKRNGTLLSRKKGVLKLLRNGLGSSS